MSRRFWQLYLSSIVLTVVASAANAQLPGTAGAPQPITGTVRYAIGSKPVEHIVVRCSGTGGISEQVTDANGRFSFRVTAGHYECSVRVPGYRNESRSLDVLNSGEFLDFRLTEDGRAKSHDSRAGTPLVDANIPDAARKEFTKAEEALATGKKEKVEEAVQHLEKAVTLCPKYLEAQLKLGTTYMDLQQFDKAEPALKKTLEIDPKAANAAFALGEVYLRAKKDEDAEKVLLQGLEVEDRSSWGHLTLARVYVDMAAKIKDETQNRPFRVKAFDQVNESLKYNADNSLAHWIKGNLLVSVGRNQDAQHEFEEYVRLDPKGPLSDKAKALIERIKKVESEKKP